MTGAAWGQGASLTVTKCVRCGGDHAGVTVTPFSRPPEQGPYLFAMCPTVREPILIWVRDEKTVQLKPSTDMVLGRPEALWPLRIVNPLPAIAFGVAAAALGAALTVILLGAFGVLK